MIALATVKQPHTKPVGTLLQFEVTVEAKRHRVLAKVVKTFFNPKRKTATPIL